MRENLPNRGFLRKLFIFLAICWILLQMFAYARLFNAYSCVESEQGSCQKKSSVNGSRRAEAWINGVISVVFIATGVAYVFSREQ
jgi:hypothetical protein